MRLTLPEDGAPQKPAFEAASSRRSRPSEQGAKVLARLPETAALGIRRATFALGFLLLFGNDGCSPRSNDRTSSVLRAPRHDTGERAFRDIQRLWNGTPAGARRSLEPALTEFAAYYPETIQSRFARLYLAIVYAETERLYRARALIEAERRAEAGRLRDLADIAHASVLVKHDKAKPALEVLKPLRGKVIDRSDRLLFSETFVAAALRSGAYAQAISQMAIWLVDAPPETLESIKATIALQLKEAPQPARERALSRLSRSVSELEPASDRAALTWLKERLRTTLVREAVASKDASLAQRLLQVPRLSNSDGAADQLLADVARTQEKKPSVSGRAVGLVLSLGTELTRNRSVQVSRGLSRALGLPAVESSPTQVKLLVLAEKDGSTAEVLARLSAEGPAILVAGVDMASAEAARVYSEKTEIPVVLLHAPEADLEQDGNALLLGTPAGLERATIEAALAKLGAEPHGLLTSEEACHRPAPGVEQNRFGGEQYRRDRIPALVLLGSAGCTSDVLREARVAGYKGIFALGLESAHLYARIAEYSETLYLRAGSFPGAVTTSPDRTHESGTPSSWYELLGHDAGKLIQVALADFPLKRAEDPKSVELLHQRARKRLLSAEAELLTTDRTGFGGAVSLPRSLEAKHAGTRG